MTGAVRKEKIREILSQMKTKLSEMERLKARLEREALDSPTPMETRKLIEDIRVPPLEVFPDKKETKRKAA